MHHSKPHPQFQTFLTSFAIFHAFNGLFALNDPKIEKQYKWALKGWNLAGYHHFTHIARAKKLRGLRQKLDPLRVQTGQSLSRYQGFGRKLVYYKRISSSKAYLNSRLFLHSICTIQSHILKFQPFPTSFATFHAFFIFLNLFQLQTFCAFNMHHSKPHPHISTHSNFICYFSCI